MLKVILIGNLGHDPVRRVTDSGKVAVSYSVGVAVGRERETVWVDVTAWDSLGEICAQYLRKGSKVCIVGRPASRGWVGQDGRARSGLSVTASEVEFLSSRREESAPEAAPAPAAPPAPQVVDDEDVPF